MKITIAIDSFKGSLSSIEAGRAVRDAAASVFPDAEVSVSALADGGEGTVAAVTPSLGGELRAVRVTGPLGEPVTAEYGVIKETETAIIEMSAAAGLTLIEAEKRNPLYTTTYGVGELIADAIGLGCRRFIIGIGGSATNDGGAGMLEALGFSLLDSCGKTIPRGAHGLKELASIGCEGALRELSECNFYIACDVTNPLLGKTGCSRVYGPQKGATDEMIKNMDLWLGHYAELTEKALGVSAKDTPGAGAAGGMGFAFLTFLGARLESGIELVMRETGLEKKIMDTDVVVTGEGRLDGQAAMGKAPVGVARLAKKYDKPVIAFAGSITDDAVKCNEYGIDAFFPILRSVCTLDEAMDKKNALQNLKRTAEQAFRLISTFYRG